MRYDGGEDTPLRLFLGRATASFLRRHFLAAEEWFRRANLDAFRLEERPRGVATAGDVQEVATLAVVSTGCESVVEISTRSRQLAYPALNFCLERFPVPTPLRQTSQLVHIHTGLHRCLQQVHDELFIHITAFAENATDVKQLAKVWFLLLCSALLCGFDRYPRPSATRWIDSSCALPFLS